MDLAEPAAIPNRSEALRIRLFGGLVVESGSAIALRRFRTRKTAALLAFVATSGRAGVPRERLIEIFWPEDEPKSARASLSTSLASIRSSCIDLSLPEVLAADRFAVWLSPHVETDLDEFERLASRSGMEPDPNLRICWLQSALDLYTGPYLEGYDDEWILTGRQSRSDEYVRAVRKLVKQHGELGGRAAAIKVARTAVRMEPTRESLARDLMRLLLAAGEPASALDVYRNLERSLQNEFGIAPSAKAARLVELIEGRRIEPYPTGTSVPEPSPEWPRIARNISTFVGRNSERSLIAKLLQNEQLRVVTIVGFGGLGKSRLAREATVDVQDRFMHGAYWVGLDGYTTAEAFWTALAKSLDIATQKEQAVIAKLQDRAVLLVVDNAEHLIPELADHIGRLLGACSMVKVVVTSRIALRMDGEHVVRIGPLKGEEGNDDVGLFMARLAAANPGHDLSPSDMESLHKFVPHLGGIPLAIEMVAAATQVTRISDLIRQIPVLAELSSARVDHQGRHKLLSSVIKSSLDLLSPTARILLNRLWPMDAGFTWEVVQEAAGAIDRRSGAIMAAIRELEEFSILYSVESRHGHRFMMLRVIRESVEIEMSDADRRESVQWAASWLGRGTELDDCLGYRSEQTVINGIQDADNIVAVAQHAFSLGLFDLAADVLSPHAAAFKLSDHVPAIIELVQSLEEKVDEVRRLRLLAKAAVLAIVGTNMVEWPTAIVDRFLERSECSGDAKFIAVARIYKAVRTVWHTSDYETALREMERAFQIPREKRAAVTGNLVELWANEVLIGAGQFHRILDTLARIRSAYGIRPGLEEQMYCAELSYCSSYVGRFEEGAVAAKRLREICERYGDFPNFGHSFFLEATSLCRAGRFEEALPLYDRHHQTMAKYVALDKPAVYVGQGCAALCCIMLGRREEVKCRRRSHGPDMPLDIYEGILYDELENVAVAVRRIFQAGITFWRLDNSASNFDFASALAGKLGNVGLASRLAGHSDLMRTRWGVPPSESLRLMRSHVTPAPVTCAQADLVQTWQDLVKEVLDMLAPPSRAPSKAC